MEEKQFDLSIGNLSERTRCPIETIRYYERIGILPPPNRTASGRRVYGDDGVRRLGFIRRARELDFSLEQTRALLALADRPEGRSADVRAIAAAHLDELRSKLTELQRTAERLEALLTTNADADPARCPIIATLAGTMNAPSAA